MVKAVAVNCDGNVLIACDTRVDGSDQTWLVDSAGCVLQKVEGRNPKLVNGPVSNVFLLVEVVGENGCVACQVKEFSGSCAIREVGVPSNYDRSFNAGMIYDADAGTLLVVCESCPNWGFNELMGQFRELELFMLKEGEDNFRPGPGTGNGILPLPKRAFFDAASDFNYTPIQPKLVQDHDRLKVLYKEFRYVGQKAFGWNLSMTEFVAHQWTRPKRRRIIPTSMQ